MAHGSGLDFHTDWYIAKFDDPEGSVEDAAKKGMSLGEATVNFADRLEEVEHVPGNIATTAGIKFIAYAFTGLGGAPSSSNKFDATYARLVVGTGSTAAARANTYASFTNPVAMAMDTGYPTITDNGESGCVLKWQATYGTSDANQAWNEFGLENATSSQVLFDRVVHPKGTKESGKTWILYLTMRLA